MKNEKSVYQTKEYKVAIAGESKTIHITDDFFATERIIKLPILGKKKILEARGTPQTASAKEFKKISKNYFYGTIAPTVANSSYAVLNDLNYKEVKNHTILINLKKEKEELWKNLEKKSARWGVKTAEKNNLVFTKATQEEIDAFYKLYENTTKEGKFKAKSKEFIKKLSNTEISNLFLVKSGKKILCGGLVLIDKEHNYSILDLTAASEEGTKLQAMPFLYWNLILYSKSLGLQYFDLGGYDKEAQRGDKMYNINKFKERFGGEITEQPIYSTNQKYPLIRKALKKFKTLKHFHKKRWS